MAGKPRLLYLIPARAGSKGIPRKNLQPLGGMPLVCHSVLTALEVAPSASDVVVSTDSEEIAEVARKAGASVPFLRPAELATDSAGSREVMLHALNALPGYDGVVLLQPTSPFRNADDVRGAVELFGSEKPDMVVGVKPAATNPYYNAYETRPDGSLAISKGDGMVTRRQDAPEVWEFDGSLYVIAADSLRAHPSLARLPRILPFQTTSPFPIDIDTPLDLALARLHIDRPSF